MRIVRIVHFSMVRVVQCVPCSAVESRHSFSSGEDSAPRLSRGTLPAEVRLLPDPPGRNWQGSLVQDPLPDPMCFVMLRYVQTGPNRSVAVPRSVTSSWILRYPDHPGGRPAQPETRSWSRTEYTVKLQSSDLREMDVRNMFLVSFVFLAMLNELVLMSLLLEPLKHEGWKIQYLENLKIM